MQMVRDRRRTTIPTRKNRFPCVICCGQNLNHLIQTVLIERPSSIIEAIEIGTTKKPAVSYFLSGKIMPMMTEDNGEFNAAS